MSKRAALSFQVLVIVGLAGLGLRALAEAQTPAALTVHEWGTFTTIAEPDGQAMQWLPLGGPADLPCFVETFQTFQNGRGLFKYVAPELGPALDYQSARAGLKGCAWRRPSFTSTPTVLRRRA